MGEVLRRVDEVAKAQERTVERLDAMAEKLEERYVPRREYEQRVRAIEQDIESQAQWRRQVTGGILVGVLMLLANLIVTLSDLPGLRG